MINDYINPVIVLNMIHLIVGYQAVNLIIGHPSPIFFFMDLNVLSNAKNWEVYIHTVFKAYSGHLCPLSCA